MKKNDLRTFKVRASLEQVIYFIVVAKDAEEAEKKVNQICKNSDDDFWNIHSTHSHITLETENT